VRLPSGAPLHVPLRQPSGNQLLSVRAAPDTHAPLPTHREGPSPLATARDRGEAPASAAASSDAGEGGGGGGGGGGGEGPAAELFAYRPGAAWEPYAMYDTDDLEVSGIYVLLTAEGAYVWVGAEADQEAARRAEALGRECLGAVASTSRLASAASTVTVVPQQEEDAHPRFFAPEHWPNG